MRRIPSVDFWSFQDFIHARYLQFEAQAKRQQLNQILTAPDEKVYCDFCANQILPSIELLNVVDFGTRVVCDGCYQKSYAHKKILYRTLREDGTLGSFVKEDADES